MSGVHRLFSRREKKGAPHSHSKTFQTSQAVTTARRPEYFGPVFALDNDNKKPSDKEEERRIDGILERLRHFGVQTMVESNARYALRATSSQGDGEAAFKLLMLLQETYEGEVKTFNPNTALVGAVNRESTTCFLDALLFSMFARLDGFEGMLFDRFSDIPRKRLAGLLRLWVNMLRTGRLIPIDITKLLQDALAACGWEDAAKVKQQDPSEAFTFITGQLELPLLTLKMDLYHTGKEDLQDDHKFVNERLLEVAIPDAPLEGSDVITLEDCLEHYFNNRIEVKRHMESQKRNTLKSASVAVAFGGDTLDTPSKEKGSGCHVEVAELANDALTPLASIPSADFPVPATQIKDPLERLRPSMSRRRADSIFSQRRVEIVGIDPQEAEKEKTPDSQGSAHVDRKMSTKTEVLMPAWQFFKLLPWYTDHMPETDAQVAAHFSRKRPILGICLKRYAYTSTGQATKRDSYVDIPLEIAVPNFVSDEHMQTEGPLVGNFRLLLQSVVCHRGVSVHSGHYISLCRGRTPNAESQPREQESRRGSTDSEGADDSWMRFDDLAKPRVSNVDIREALKQETPYLLFYQVQPIGDDGHSIHDLPTYAEATSRSQSDVTLAEKGYFPDAAGSENAISDSQARSQLPALSRPASDTVDFAAYSSVSARMSTDALPILDSGPRGRSLESRRRSIAFDGSSYGGSASTSGGSIRTADGNSIPTTPSEGKDKIAGTGGGLLSVAAGRMGTIYGSRKSKSRPSSTGPADAGAGNAMRFGGSMARLTQRLSNRDGPAAEAGEVDNPAEGTGDTLAGAAAPGANEVQDPAAGKAPPTTTTTTSRPATSSKKDKVFGSGRYGKPHKRKGVEERDCVVM